MLKKKNILAIIGSASSNSSNLKLVEYVERKTEDDFNFIIYNDLKLLPQFDPELSVSDPPAIIIELRNAIIGADGIIICTPEYVFSIPSGLKNAIEWCISTTIFSDKPCGIITASANGQKGHDELILIMKTVMAKVIDDATLLINGIKGKINYEGNLTDSETTIKLNDFIIAFKKLVKSE